MFAGMLDAEGNPTRYFAEGLLRPLVRCPSLLEAACKIAFVNSLSFGILLLAPVLRICCFVPSACWSVQQAHRSSILAPCVVCVRECVSTGGSLEIRP